MADLLPGQLFWLLLPKLVSAARKGRPLALKDEAKELACLLVEPSRNINKRLGQKACQSASEDIARWTCAERLAENLRREFGRLKPAYRNRNAALRDYKDALQRSAVPASRVAGVAEWLAQKYTDGPGHRRRELTCEAIARYCNVTPKTVGEKWPAAYRLFLTQCSELTSQHIKEAFLHEAQRLEDLRQKRMRKHAVQVAALTPRKR